MLPTPYRITHRAIFQRLLVQRQGVCLARHPLFTVVALPARQPESLPVAGVPGSVVSRCMPRIACVISKKIDKRAVVRNRLRRRWQAVVREAIMQSTLPPLTLLTWAAAVVIFRPGSAGATVAAITEAMQPVFQKLQKPLWVADATA